MSDSEIILQALLEFEKNHWQSEGIGWQKKINKLISYYRKERK